MTQSIGGGARIGFTGTREGMTELQKASLRKLLIDLRADGLHHGDCLGADAEAHDIALELGLCVYIHPPKDETHRAFCKGACFVDEPATHFARNRKIVDSTDILIGASIAPHPLPKGGTWYTIDYRLKKNSAYVIWPDGTVSILPQGFKTK